MAAATQNIKERDLWLKKLAGEFEKSHVPYDLKKAPGKENTWNTSTFKISGDLFAKLMKLRNGVDYTYTPSAIEV
ncbi:MAG: hypothetical protein GY765_07235 [bacterium]|nr:hypothetical protein [bacterium]